MQRHRTARTCHAAGEGCQEPATQPYENLRGTQPHCKRRDNLLQTLRKKNPSPHCYIYILYYTILYYIMLYYIISYNLLYYIYIYVYIYIYIYILYIYIYSIYIYIYAPSTKAIGPRLSHSRSERWVSGGTSSGPRSTQ